MNRILFTPSKGFKQTLKERIITNNTLYDAIYKYMYTSHAIAYMDIY